MRCKYLADSQCKNKATHLYGGKIGVCEQHKALLEKIIESKGGLVGDEFVVITPPNKARTRRGAGGSRESKNTVAPRG